MIKNYITFVIDESSSMEIHRHKLPKIFSQLANDIAERSQKMKQASYIAVRMFSDRVKDSSGFQSAERFMSPMYNPNGWTALYDAVKYAIEDHQRVKRTVLDDIAHLIVVLTDGEENRSQTRAWELKSLMTSVSENTTIAWQVPTNQNRDGLVRQLGIPADNITVWDPTTQQGLIDSYVGTRSAFDGYTQSRAEGLTRSTNFYATTTDLSDIEKKDLKTCDNHTAYFTPRIVDKEQRIDEFVANVTGKPYLKGTAFYQLTKPELIQGNKDLKLREKGLKTIYGGQKVRELVGLEAYKDGKVKPGNQANYDVFVQSMSENRKLVRGTTVLVAK